MDNNFVLAGRAPSTPPLTASCPTSTCSTWRAADTSSRTSTAPDSAETQSRSSGEIRTQSFFFGSRILEMTISNFQFNKPYHTHGTVENKIKNLSSRFSFFYDSMSSNCYLYHVPSFKKLKAEPFISVSLRILLLVFGA